MKTARIVVLGVAVLAAGGVAYMATESPQPAPQAAAPSNADTVKVLVAASDINVGTGLTAANLRWQEWPVSAVSDVYITEKSAPKAMQDWVGAVTRAPFVAGEPLRPQKLIKGNGSGFLSAILPAGMRAVSTRIGVDTAAGGFILPNDRVDILLTRRDTASGQKGGDAWTSETLLKNVRVLAIDQTIEDQNGQKVITGSTATLELAPQQSEVLALAKELGTLSLALRSLADSNPMAAEPDPGANVTKGLAVVRYGVVTNVVDR